MEKKYELGEEKDFDGVKLRRVVALRDFGDVKKGDVGGWIECEGNLSHEGRCWVYGNARVGDGAWVGGDAWVGRNAKIEGGVIC